MRRSDLGVEKSRPRQEGLPPLWRPLASLFPPRALFSRHSHLPPPLLFCLSVQDYGAPEAYLSSIAYLLGEQSYSGETQSEGGFEKNKVSKANIISSGVRTDKKGKSYYTYEVLTTSADGNEGGSHSLIATTVSGGALYTIKISAGDKRWFKGVERIAKTSVDSFTVA